MLVAANIIVGFHSRVLTYLLEHQYKINYLFVIISCSVGNNTGAIEKRLLMSRKNIDIVHDRFLSNIDDARKNRFNTSHKIEGLCRIFPNLTEIDCNNSVFLVLIKTKQRHRTSWKHHVTFLLNRKSRCFRHISLQTKKEYYLLIGI